MPPSISSSERVQQYPGEPFTVSANKLFCNACRMVIKTKKSTIELHIKSYRHCKAKESAILNPSRDQSIVSMLQHNEQASSRIDTATRAYRYRVERAFLSAGIPLSKITWEIRGLLEEAGHRLTDRSHLSALIPDILAEERRRIQEEINSRDISVCFDTTTHASEVFAVTIRYVDNLVIHQMLAALRLLREPITAAQCTAELITLITGDLRVNLKNVVAMAHDRCSVNCAAMDTMKKVMLRVIDIGCLSHVLNTVGEKFDTPTLDKFASLWTQLHVRSVKSRALWKSLTGVSPLRPSPTRWWSSWEMIAQVFEYKGHLLEFLGKCSSSPTIVPKIQDLIADHEYMLYLEMAAVVDAGAVLVKATYSVVLLFFIVFNLRYCYNRNELFNNYYIILNELLQQLLVS
mgnify:CR=1 FL=1